MDLNDQSVLALRAPETDGSSEGTLYGLIDHAAIPMLTRTLTRMGVSWQSLFEGSRNAGALEVAPILVPIRYRDNQLIPHSALKWVCQRGQFTSSLLFLESRLSAPELARRLAFRIDVTLPDDFEVVFRYFDSRVFETAMGILDGLQRNNFLSIATAWWYVTRSGELVKVSQDSVEPTQTDQPLLLNVAQESKFLEMSEVDNVIGLIREYLNHQYEAILPKDRHNVISRHVHAAHQHGIQAPHELALYCCLVLENGDDYFECGRGKAVLMEMREKSINLTEVVQNC
ncbi:DUF4123 domain-containing protein [Massilia sp. PAMC28688]|uniref:DUF4123 domain-containing protein n=1 Tax=Massilia sp. PAMC28688 TaxID=2861283 RepID=UPI001C631CDB|nr:DUF4123 domain-containing protein [Massilia sp. PAMC28688]QYF92054.1 DUF4123 domain-containing protein [Massilia sp. PAMC28688]